MNKPRRERKRPWRCLGCNMPMHRTLGDRIHKQMQRELPQKKVKTVHVCGKCKTLHLAEDGKLRLLTTGEQFEYQLHCGDELSLIEQTNFGALGYKCITVITRNHP